MPAAPVSGLAFRMRQELAHLALMHGTAPPKMVELPLAPPIAGDALVTGLAMTDDVDAARQRFRPWALAWNPYAELPELRYRHGELAGQLTALHYDERGRLWAEARVSHDVAKRCQGFSVGAAIRSYEIRNADRPDYVALITAAELTEISLTPSPCNSRAVVTSRVRASPATKFFDLMTERVACLQHLTALVRSEV